MKLQRKLLITVALLALTIGSVGIGVLGDTAPSEQVRLLVIDETHSIQSSLQIELFAKTLVGAGTFRIHALTEIPTEKNTEDPYDIVVIVPSIVEQVWIVTPDVPSRLTPTLVQALHVVESITDKMYEGEHTLDPRAVVGVTDDLFPAVYSGFLVQNGWL
jgi:hypothetical protein